jgi:hypothetical protein
MVLDRSPIVEPPLGGSGHLSAGPAGGLARAVRGGRPGACRADPLEQRARGFIVRVLRDELALEGELEDGLAEALRAGELGADGLLDFVSNREEAVDFGDDSVLLGQRRQRNG